MVLKNLVGDKSSAINDDAWLIFSVAFSAQNTYVAASKNQITICQPRSRSQSMAVKRRKEIGMRLIYTSSRMKIIVHQIAEGISDTQTDKDNAEDRSQEFKADDIAREFRESGLQLISRYCWVPLCSDARQALSKSPTTGTVRLILLVSSIGL